MIYFIKNVVNGNFKIGFSAAPRKRLKELQTGSSDRLVLIRMIDGDKNLERQLHERFSAHRLDGEWFSPSEEIMSFIAGDSQRALEGKFFHTFKDGALCWQGYVVSKPADGYYLVQLLEWFMGEPSCKKLVRVESMVGWDFYDTAEEMNAVYEEKWARRQAVERGSDSAT